MSAFRFRPQLESLSDRITPSSVAAAAPTEAGGMVTYEYLVLAAVPTRTRDDVLVGGRTDTADGLYFYPLSHPVRMLETRS